MTKMNRILGKNAATLTELELDDDEPPPEGSGGSGCHPLAELLLELLGVAYVTPPVITQLPHELITLTSRLIPR